MIRPALILTRDEYLILMEELAGSRPGEDYDPVFRMVDKVEPLREKLYAALSQGCNVVIRPEVLAE